MNNESIENLVVNTEDIEEGEKGADILEYNYPHYLELGGIINEKDYQSVIDRVNKTHILDRRISQVRSSIFQAVGIARHAGIELNGTEKNQDYPMDVLVVLYVILRLGI